MSPSGMRCTACAVVIEGEWIRCPLCDETLCGEPVPGPLPVAPLAFSRRRVLKTLFLTSLAMIALSFAAQLFFSVSPPGPGVLRIIWLGIASLWLIVLMAARKRRNLAKGTVYLVVIVGLICAYWDYLTGWHGWSLSYAIPIVCGSSILALLLTMRLMRVEAGDHVLYTGLTVLLGLVPIAFLLLGWVSPPLPSIVCGALSLAALGLLQLSRGAEVRHELGKRLHL